MYMFQRKIALPANPRESLFLWGPRQTGKSTLLRRLYPDAAWIDLLKADEFRRYNDRPELLRQEIEAKGQKKLVVIDEIQKVPSLLDEVHWLIENQKTRFVLCGSSARKLRRGHANLLGGRALRYELFGLVFSELRDEFDLGKILNRGYLPRHYTSERSSSLLRSYVGDYLKEEIAAEGLARNLASFSSFLDAASLSDAELVNFSTIARECGVSGPTIRGYFEILTDTLMGRWLPAYTKRPKRRVIGAPKFYFSDVGVVNVLAKRRQLEPGTELFGKAFENWVFHELCARDHYTENFLGLSYWRLAGGTEVDFIVGDMDFAIEAKSTTKVTSDHLAGLRALAQDQSRIKKRIVVCLEPKARMTEDKILILPAREFATRLWAGMDF